MIFDTFDVDGWLALGMIGGIIAMSAADHVRSARKVRESDAAHDLAHDCLDRVQAEMNVLGEALQALKNQEFKTETIPEFIDRLGLSKFSADSNFRQAAEAAWRAVDADYEDDDLLPIEIGLKAVENLTATSTIFTRGMTAGIAMMLETEGSNQ